MDSKLYGFYNYISENITISRDMARGSIVNPDIGLAESFVENASWQNNETGLRTAIFTSFLDDGLMRKAKKRAHRGSFASERSSMASERPSMYD